MEGRWHGQPYYDYKEKQWLVTFELDATPSVYEETKDKPLDIEIKEHKSKRSTEANRLMWDCLGKIAAALNADKWDIYLQELKKYGKFTYVVIKPNAFDSFVKNWRICENLGEINVNGDIGVQLLCYFGSSSYDSKEFSTLLNGIISDMKDMGLQTPSEREFEEAIKQWKAS